MQLTGIFNCTITDWNTIKATLPYDNIEPCSPVSGSGTRTFFVASIGVMTPHGCVWQPAASLQNSNGVAVAAAAAAVVDDTTLTVFSPRGAVYTSQKNGVPGVPDEPGGAVLRNIDGKGRINATTGLLNPNFAHNFLRLVYNVVKPDATTGTSPAAYQRYFGDIAALCGAISL